MLTDTCARAQATSQCNIRKPSGQFANWLGCVRMCGAEGALCASALPMMREIRKRRLCEGMAAGGVLHDETATLLILLGGQIAHELE